MNVEGAVCGSVFIYNKQKCQASADSFVSVSANSRIEMEASYKWLNAAIEQTDVHGVFLPQEQTKHKNTLKKQYLISLYTWLDRSKD